MLTTPAVLRPTTCKISGQKTVNHIGLLQLFAKVSVHPYSLLIAQQSDQMLTGSKGESVTWSNVCMNGHVSALMHLTAGTGHPSTHCTYELIKDKYWWGKSKSTTSWGKSISIWCHVPLVHRLKYPERTGKLMFLPMTVILAVLDQFL